MATGSPSAGNSVTTPAVVMRPILPAVGWAKLARSVNHSAPSGPVVRPKSWPLPRGIGNSLITPAVGRRPLVLPASSNHSPPPPPVPTLRKQDDPHQHPGAISILHALPRGMLAARTPLQVHFDIPTSTVSMTVSLTPTHLPRERRSGVRGLINRRWRLGSTRRWGHFQPPQTV